MFPVTLLLQDSPGGSVAAAHSVIQDEERFIFSERFNN